MNLGSASYRRNLREVVEGEWPFVEGVSFEGVVIGEDDITLQMSVKIGL